MFVEKVFSVMLFLAVLMPILYGPVSYGLAAEIKASEVKSITFEELPLPETDEEKVTVRSSPKATVLFADGTSKDFTLSYRTLLRTGDKDPDGDIFGLLLDKSGDIIRTAYNPDWVSVYPDADSAFKRSGRYYLLTHLEGIPGAVYLTEFRKDTDGKLKPVRFRPMDFSSLGGTVGNCAGSKTGWDTHLGGEEDYNFDAYYFDPATVSYAGTHVVRCGAGKRDRFCQSLEDMKRYLKAESYSEVNPYNYGHILEISFDTDAKPRPVKHHVMGKGTPELALAMPDSRTVYLTDDGAYAGFYMFVADKEKDLSSGTLYMARWAQKDSNNGGIADLEWVRLGHGTDREVGDIIDKRPLISDIFDIRDPEACPEGYTLIKAGSPGLMCLRLRDGVNGSTISGKFKGREEALKAAAFLETRKFGAYSGATAEFNKEEGLVYDPERNTLYVAMTSIDRSMEDNPQDPGNHIRLPNNRCGAVYQIQLGETVDTLGKKIESRFAGTGMRAAVAGRPLKPGEKYGDENGCDPSYVANPDNLGIYKNILFIGEDSAFHLNNMAWAYDIEKGALTRILTLPTGAELTGTFHKFEADGRLYIFVNAQHPLGDVSKGAAGKVSNYRFLNNAGKADKDAYVGYIFGLPSSKPAK